MDLLTPYLIIDSKALIECSSIVRQLVKMKRFIVLIPVAGE